MGQTQFPTLCAAIMAAPFKHPIVLVRRLLRESGDYLTAADVRSIEISISEIHRPGKFVPGYNARSLPPEKMITELITDSPWAWDEIGFNFLCILPASAIPEPDSNYRVEFKVTLLGGSGFYLRWRVATWGDVDPDQWTKQRQAPPVPSAIREARLVIEEILMHRVLWQEPQQSTAIRQAERLTHPDTGGNAADFKRVQNARDVILGS